MKKILCALLLPASLYAAHFDKGRVIVRLVGDDSLTVAFEGDAEDMMNTVQTFPYYLEKGDSVYRIYERRLEVYLQQRLIVKVDGRRLYPSVIAWKPDGKGPGDRFDSVSIRSADHLITLGMRLPAPLDRLKTLDVRSDVWAERTEATPAIEFSFLQGDKLLWQRWERPERTVRLSLARDSLAAMRAKAPTVRYKARSRQDDDHKGHGH